MSKVGNYEYKILSRLKDKKRYSWSDILSHIPSIHDSTLFDNLKRLINSESIIKEKTILNGKSKKTYRITKIGLDRYKVLKTLTIGIKYPPNNIPFESDKERVIWLLNTNEFCRWKDFEDERTGIQTGSLSRLLNRLRQNRIIEKQSIFDSNRPVYRVLKKGRDQFTVMLKKYDISKEIVQRENIRRIRRIVDEIEEFVSKIGIDNEEVLIRFFKYVELFEDKGLRRICTNEEHYYITLLYLAFNHPYRYPRHVPIHIFAQKFTISENTLLHYIEFLSSPKLKKIFAKIVVPSNHKKYIYYFLREGKLSQRLESIIEEYLEKKIVRNALKGLPIAMDDSFITKMDISLLNTLIFDRYNLLSEGLRTAEFVKTYLEQQSSQYTLRESHLNVDALVKYLIRGRDNSKENIMKM